MKVTPTAIEIQWGIKVIQLRTTKLNIHKFYILLMKVTPTAIEIQWWIKVIQLQN